MKKDEDILKEVFKSDIIDVLFFKDKMLEAMGLAKNEVKEEVEDLRIELCKKIEDYTQICERLWIIANKK